MGYAKAYAQNRASLKRTGIVGAKLSDQRIKLPFEEFDVPLLDEVHRLFAVYPNGPAPLSHDCLNRYAEDIERELGITTRRGTVRLARKTFGCLVLVNSYRIGKVSHMLDHTCIPITEGHHVRFVGSGVDRDRLKT